MIWDHFSKLRSATFIDNISSTQRAVIFLNIYLHHANLDTLVCIYPQQATIRKQIGYNVLPLLRGKELKSTDYQLQISRQFKCYIWALAARLCALYIQTPERLGYVCTPTQVRVQYSGRSCDRSITVHCSLAQRAAPCRHICPIYQSCSGYAEWHSFMTYKSEISGSSGDREVSSRKTQKMDTEKIQENLWEGCLLKTTNTCGWWALYRPTPPATFGFHSAERFDWRDYYKHIRLTLGLQSFPTWQ